MESDAVSVLMDISIDSSEISFPKSKRAYISMKEVLEYGETAPYDTRFPAYVIEGLIVSFLLAITAIIGIVCTCQIQTPELFETPHKHRD